jgi:hypothetical protein
MHKQGFKDDINSTHVFCKFREMLESYMNIETILPYTYYIQIHKLTTIEYPNTFITNWHQTLKCPAQDLSLSQLIRIYPRVSCHRSDINTTQYCIGSRHEHSNIFSHIYEKFIEIR